MSSKSDSDNRSNQLNPNNSAYASSRAGVHCNEDDDDVYEESTLWYRNAYRFSASKIEKVGQFGFGVVSPGGHARFFTFRLKGSRHENSIFVDV